MIKFEELKEKIQANQNFVLTTHVNPDADAIGSELALYFILKELKKDVAIINYSETPYNLVFLDKDKKIEQFNNIKHIKILQKTDVIIAIDFNRLDRTRTMEELIKKSNAKKICIDHHSDPNEFADFYYSDIEYAATGQILYDLLKNTNICSMTKNIAENLYAAIMTDTGSFRFDKTTPELHLIIADLLKAGANPTYVYDQIYDQSLLSKLKLLGKTLSTLTLYGEQKQIAYMVITQKMFDEVGALESDTDGFVNNALSIKNIKIGILFIELQNGYKINFRSKGDIPVNKLAAKFGGGGHKNASGARLYNKDIFESIPEVLLEAEKYLN